MNDDSLKMQIEAQITGLRNHLYHLTERHRRVETNTRRALGHANEAIRLSLKLRRLYIAHAPADLPEVAVKITLENDYPVNSTRFLLPTLALRGFWGGPRMVIFALWTWRLVIRLPNSVLCVKGEKPCSNMRLT